MSHKLGSLFDGSGGFPLAGALCDIEPIWASEVEPYPIAVTKSRFPKLKHLGDISKINGAEIEPVDIITFGSPCQDLSVAGKRAGLKHEANGDEETTRSGLFMEAVRIIKEMREKTDGRYPTFALWENVPGAFSSNKGEDFKVVLEELIKVVEPTAVMPGVPQKGWNYADSYIGDGWSLAYRVLDAQYWGVPQRRRRIYLVADFRGERAREILFEREGLRGYFTQGRTPWQTTPTDAQGSTGADDREGETPYTLKIRSGCEGGGKGALIQKDKSATLATNNDQYLFQPMGVDTYNLSVTGDKTVTLRAGSEHNYAPVIQPLGVDPYNGDLTRDKSSTLGVNCRVSTGRNGVVTLEPGIAAREGGHIYEGVSGTLRANAGDNQMAVAYSIENHPADSRVNLDESGKVQTLTSRMDTGGGNVPMVMEPKPVICLQGNGIDRADTAGCNGKGWREDASYTLNTIDRPAVVYNASKASFFMRASKNAPADTLVATDYKDPQLVAYGFDPSASRDVGTLFLEECGKTLTNGTCPGHHDGVVIKNTEKPHYIVRRLTPTECARLQGFADRWGEVDAVDKLSQKDYQFWLEVRKTYDAINGREPKDYTVKQMLTWYNKLQTDSAEYKMWGNGIALPTALYVLQGVADALSWEEYEI